MAKRTRADEAAWSAYASELAVNLHRIRLERGLSQEDVAYAAGLTRYTYQKYEKGESKPGTPANPTLRTLLALCQALEVTLVEVLPTKTPDLRLR
ncbi:helix-turn-helix transcriptional regulator [Microbacterium capsulatum]|uniref:Helix-turn-helix transcriptional regulator n=1 Tax=Microbacterium capsulatum TaxID=3041921 RepID=A0ABU0XK98_9MICO|nr:helix-turn-helix transcriptional regulator [Microbacterium sp. ASV81]MDQ4215059.1 helix-turn-helix transcriptional regulator [Microbacterium sp. ASV81]